MRLKEGDPKGRHVVIVDDLVQSGGTLIECQVYQSSFHLICTYRIVSCPTLVQEQNAVIDNVG